MYTKLNYMHIWGQNPTHNRKLVTVLGILSISSSTSNKTGKVELSFEMELARGQAISNCYSGNSTLNKVFSS